MIGVTHCEVSQFCLCMSSAMLASLVEGSRYVRVCSDRVLVIVGAVCSVTTIIILQSMSFSNAMWDVFFLNFMSP